jgi:hypothetical protein
MHIELPTLIIKLLLEGTQNLLKMKVWKLENIDPYYGI